MATDLAFIVSAGRSGTRLVGEGLNAAIADCRAVHEPDSARAAGLGGLPARLRELGLRHLVLGRALGRSSVGHLARRRFVRPPPDGEIEAAIRAQRSTLHDRVREPLLIESNDAWHGLLPQLRAAFPRARIVAVIRDPRAWVRELLDRNRSGELARRFPWPGPRRIHPRDVADAEGTLLWPTLDAFGRLCWDWRFAHRLIVPFAWGDPLTRLYRYEDLFAAAGDESLQDLLAFVTQHDERQYAYEAEGAAPTGGESEPGLRTPPWPEWSDAGAALLDRLCGPLMHQYGYGKETAWREKVAAGRSGNAKGPQSARADASTAPRRTAPSNDPRETEGADPADS